MPPLQPSPASPARRAAAVALVLLLVTVSLAGCIAPGGGDAPLAETSHDAPGDARNPWQAGLATDHPTPDVAEHRSRDERRANLAEPGDLRFAEFDAAFEAFMESHGIPTGQVAIMHEGELRYTRGYGAMDPQGASPTTPHTMFRIASITKPMTAAVVSMQVEQGMYNLTDPVFCIPAADPPANCLLPIEPHPKFPVVDERLRDVTVQHLLDHTGGWDPSMNYIFLGNGNIQIAREMGVPTPPPTWRLAQYVLGQPLEADPGTEYAYCNTCFILAGLIAEAQSGATMQALYDAYLWRPLEVSGDIEVGRTLPAERNPREAFYACELGRGPSVFDPNETVCLADGWFSLKQIRAAGGVVATAAAVAAVYEVVGHHAFTYLGAGPITWRGHPGGIPGTATMTGVLEDNNTLTGKVQYVALFNQVGYDEPYFPASHSYRFEDPLLALAAGWGAAENAQK